MEVAGGFPQIAGAGDPVISCGFLWQPVDSRAKRGRAGDCKAASARGSCGFADHMTGRQRGAGAARIFPKDPAPFPGAAKRRLRRAYQKRASTATSGGSGEFTRPTYIGPLFSLRICGFLRSKLCSKVCQALMF